MKLLIALVVLAVVSASGCAPCKTSDIMEGTDSAFQAANRLFNEKHYSEAAAAYSEIAKESAGTERGANALFSAAVMYAYYENPHKDYLKALQSFDEFLQTYPNSDRARDARNWRALFKNMLELKKENEHLQQNINKLKQIDIRHEERRKRR